MPEYTAPMFSYSEHVLTRLLLSISVVGNFFSVASTTPFDALMPRLVAPAFTAASACSICTSFPLGLKVVRLNE